MVNIHLSEVGRFMHGPPSEDERVLPFLSELKDMNYEGQLTLEINDLVLPRELSYQEKIAFMKEEIAWIKDSL